MLLSTPTSDQHRVPASGRGPLRRWSVRVAAAVLMVISVGWTPTAARAEPGYATSGPVLRPVAYRVPVNIAVVVLRPFDGPAGPYSAGHRGVDLAVADDGAVLAAAPGTVTFAGQVAGRGLVVIAHADGIRTEYEPLDPAVRAGQVVVQGSLLGSIAGTHPGCPRILCLHWAARRGAVYLDPMTLLRRLGVVHLVPLTTYARGCACRYAWRSRSTETWV